MLQRKTNPLEYAEQCKLVKSGDAVVDGHCFPSTIQGEMGELVDQHRLACYLVYTQCLKLCEKYGVPLTEKMLKRGMVKQGDWRECCIYHQSRVVFTLAQGQSRLLTPPPKKIPRQNNTVA